MTPRVPRNTALALEKVEREAWQDLFAAASPEVRRALGLRPLDLAGGWVMATDQSDSLLHNRALGLGLREPISDAVVDALREHFRGHAAGFAVNLCPYALPADAAARLERHGFATFFHHLKWLRGAEPVQAAPSDLRVERASAADARRWGELSALIHDSPPAAATWSAETFACERWSHYLAFDGDTPVAVASSFVNGEAAWLGHAGTLASHRRRGAQSALFARRIADALAAGARWLSLETAPDWRELPGDSLRNAARAGFHPAYERPSWIFPVPR